MCGHTSRVSIFLYWSVNMYLCQCHAGLKNVIVYYILKSDSVRLLALFFFFSGLACFFFFLCNSHKFSSSVKKYWYFNRDYINKLPWAVHTF